MDPELVGPELLAGFAGRNSVGAFLLLSPSAISGPDPRAIERVDIDIRLLILQGRTKSRPLLESEDF